MSTRVAATLSQASVPSLASQGIPVPDYDRERLRSGIAHFGVGAFHRSHQAYVVDQLLNSGTALEWGICGIDVMPAAVRMRDSLERQDGLYTLLFKNLDGSHDARVIGSIREILHAPDDPELVIERLASPSIRIVSLTITEGGYNLDPVTGEFDADDPAIVADLAADVPGTVFGLVAAALARRRERGLPPFTVMSCDNIQGNGDMSRRAFTAYAERRDPELAEWMREHVAFPNSMVDRITPVTTDSDRAVLRDEFGIDDEVPVVAEPYFQWVLEDHFSDGRPPFEQADVKLVDDVVPYELMKLRLLNLGHQAICYFGYLSGYRHVHEAMADPGIAGLLRDYIELEAKPTLEALPPGELEHYAENLVERFASPSIRDTLTRLANNPSDRLPSWLGPLVRKRLAAGGEVHRSAAIVASWVRYSEGVDEAGQPITIVDRLAEELRELALTERDEPLAFLRNQHLFGDLASEPRFAEPYLDALRSLHERGATATAALIAGFDECASAGDSGGHPAHLAR